MNKETKNKILARKDHYYVNLNEDIFKDLTRKQVGFVVLISKLNAANLVATNREIATFLGLKQITSVSGMIKSINEKTNNLIDVKQDSMIGSKSNIVDSESKARRIGRSLHLSKPLFVKKQRYINLPDFIFKNSANFLSGNELRVYNYLKAMPNGSFTGFLRRITDKLGLSLSTIKRALKKLSNMKAIFKRSVRHVHRIKNVTYRSTALRVNSNWYAPVHTDLPSVPEEVPLKRKSEYENEMSWEDIESNIGTL